MLHSRPGEGTTAAMRIPAERLLTTGFAGSAGIYLLEDIL